MTFQSGLRFQTRLSSLRVQFGYHVNVLYITHFGAIMILRILSEADFRSFHFQFHRPRCLADSSCMVRAVQQHQDYQQQFQKKKCVRIKN